MGEIRENPLSVWMDETGSRSETASNFLRTAGNRKYNPLTELHASEGNDWRMGEKIVRGEVTPTKVNVLYQDGDVTQVHVVFDTGTGQRTDFLPYRESLARLFRTKSDDTGSDRRIV